MWTPEATFPAVKHVRVGWQPADAGEPCVLELSELFRPI